MMRRHAGHDSNHRNLKNSTFVNPLGARGERDEAVARSGGLSWTTCTCSAEARSIDRSTFASERDSTGSQLLGNVKGYFRVFEVFHSSFLNFENRN